MTDLIGNPAYWGASAARSAASHAARTARRIGGQATGPIPLEQINSLTYQDLGVALRKGLEDLGAARADALFLTVIYPLIGLLLAAFALNMALTPLLFPLAAGFALLGPFFAIGLYEISRRRELGLAYSWADAFRLYESPSFGAIVALGLYLLALFGLWMLSAHLIFQLTMGSAPSAPSAFLAAVLGTPEGWAMIVIGMAVGFVFALLALATSVVSFPLLLDQDVGVAAALATSVRVFRKNPRVLSAWGLIVALGLALGALPALIGLVIVVPALGHATWHLYRRAIRRPGAAPGEVSGSVSS